MADARQELEEVLTEFGLKWDAAEAARPNAISFWINGKRISHAHGSPDELRRRLVMLGAKQHYMPKRIELPKVEMPQEAYAPLAAVTPSVTPPAGDGMEHAMETKEPEPADRIQQQPQALPQRLNTEAGYTYYRSARVIAIELGDGKLMIIPLHRPNTVLNMTRTDFDLLFIEEPPERPPQPEPLVVETPVRQRRTRRTIDDSEPMLPMPVQPVTDQHPPEGHDEQAIMAFLRQKQGSVKAKIIASALGKTIKSVDIILRQMAIKGMVELESGFWGLTGLGRKPDPERRQISIQAGGGTRQPSTRQPPRHQDGGRHSFRGLLPPQMGRMLAAMAYVSKKTGKHDLTTQMVTPYLDQRDSKQYAARMPNAIERGLVDRGLPVPHKLGWHYTLTPKGADLIKQVKDWPYSCENLPVPEWLQYL